MIIEETYLYGVFAGEEWTTECLSGHSRLLYGAVLRWNGVGPIIIIDGRLNGENYKNILDRCIVCDNNCNLLDKYFIFAR